MSIQMVKVLNGIKKPMSIKPQAWCLSDFDELIELAAMWRDHCRQSVEFGFILDGVHYVSVETVYQNREALTLGRASFLSLADSAPQVQRAA